MTDTEARQITDDCEDLIFVEDMFDLVQDATDPFVASVLAVRVLLGNALSAYRLVLETAGVHHEHAEAEVQTVADQLYNRLLELKRPRGESGR